MSKFLKFLPLVFAVVLLLSAPAMAQEGPTSYINIPVSVGVGLMVIGAALGIGRLASTAFESMARQPEVSNQIFIGLIIAGALIEGFTVIGIFFKS